MKKVVLGLMFLLVLVGCSGSKIRVYSDTEITEFNNILENVGNGKTKAYDLREYEECYAGRISGFYCSRVFEIEDEKEALDKVVENLSLLLGDKKRTLIILVDADGKNAEYVANKLFGLGYKNIHYFGSGYNKYVELQEDFVPETGECDC